MLPSRSAVFRLKALSRAAALTAHWCGAARPISTPPPTRYRPMAPPFIYMFRVVCNKKKRFHAQRGHNGAHCARPGSGHARTRAATSTLPPVTFGTATPHLPLGNCNFGSTARVHTTSTSSTAAHDQHHTTSILTMWEASSGSKREVQKGYHQLSFAAQLTHVRRADDRPATLSHTQ